MAELKCSSIFNDAGREYCKISEAIESFKNGEITGEQFDKISLDALRNVDNIIADYIKR